MINLDSIRLSGGTHRAPYESLCLLELHDARRHPGHLDTRNVTDNPDDVAPVLREMGTCLNDAFLPKPERPRQEQPDAALYRPELEPALRALEPLLTDTASASAEQQRAWGLMALDWLVRRHIVTWLRLTPELAGHADTLAALPALTEPGALDGLALLLWETTEAAEAESWGINGYYLANHAASTAMSGAAITAAPEAERVAKDAYTLAAVAVSAAATRASERLVPTMRALQDEALALFERMLRMPRA